MYYDDSLHTSREYFAIASHAFSDSNTGSIVHETLRTRPGVYCQPSSSDFTAVQPLEHKNKGHKDDVESEAAYQRGDTGLFSRHSWSTTPVAHGVGQRRGQVRLQKKKALPITKRRSRNRRMKRFFTHDKLRAGQSAPLPLPPRPGKLFSVSTTAGQGWCHTGRAIIQKQNLKSKKTKKNKKTGRHP